MKRLFTLIIVFLFFLPLMGCNTALHADILATTLPVYEFTSILCRSTDLSVGRLISDNVSCLHDYTLQTGQMRAIEDADLIVISGAGFEDFLHDVMESEDRIIDSSAGISLICSEDMHEHDHTVSGSHNHSKDPHIWLSPSNAMVMAHNIYTGLVAQYPEYAEIFESNYAVLLSKLDGLDEYAKLQLNALSCRELVTFHDGFSYMAEAYDLQIIHAVEEESGSEASASELINLLQLINSHHINAIFTERNGSSSAATIISAETGAEIYVLDMAISGDSYFDAMYHNIDTLKEALG